MSKVKSPSQRLGEVLEARGRVAHEQTLRALRNQKVLGGRLGTCLLEIDAVSEDELLSALAEVHGVPSAGPEDLRNIDSEIIALVPAKVAKRCLAVPFHSSSTQVKVAVVDAGDLTVQDEVSFVVGKRIRWHVSTDIRIHEALDRYYGEECPTRIAKLLDRLNRARFLWARESTATLPLSALELESEPLLPPLDLGPAPGSPAAPEKKAAPVAPPPEPPPAPVAALETVPTPTPAVGVAAPEEDTQESPPAGQARGPLSIADAEKLLLDPADRDDVARALMDFAATRARRAILLVSRKQDLAAWMWAGDGLDGPALAAFRVALDEPSIFQALRDGSDRFHGVLPPVPAHRALLAAFDPPAAGLELLALPLRVRGRLVAALLVEPRADTDPKALAAELRRIVAKAAIAFELCIMRAKLRSA